MEHTMVRDKQSAAGAALRIALTVAAAVLLPQLFHAVGAISGTGTALGAALLPMHIPVLLAGLLYGPVVGVAAGVLSPLLSAAVSDMPTAALLPFMVLELGVYGLTSGFLSRTVEKKLTEGHIPYEIVGGVRFFRRMEVLDMMAYLRLIATGDDDAFRRIVNVPRRKLGRGRLELLERLAAEGPRNRTIDAADSADDDRPGGLLGALYAGLADPDVGDALRGTGAAEFARVIRALRHDAPSLLV